MKKRLSSEPVPQTVDQAKIHLEWLPGWVDNKTGFPRPDLVDNPKFIAFKKKLT